jgi:two-component system, NarL family, invasion response regulator UvrY
LQWRLIAFEKSNDSIALLYMDEFIRLVIVDDHAMMRETWKMIIERNPQIKVIAECTSGDEAVRCAEEIRPDIMLMDINMSPVNGFEATRKIAKSWPEVKIIGLSINNQPSYARNMMQLGAKGYVTKNSTAEEMMEAINTVVNGGTYLCKEIRKNISSKEN